MDFRFPAAFVFRVSKSRNPHDVIPLVGLSVLRYLGFAVCTKGGGEGGRGAGGQYVLGGAATWPRRSGDTQGMSTPR